MKNLYRAKKRIQNTLASGSGANTTNDRGAVQGVSFASNSPYYSNNFLYRYQTWANLYETSWEARKIIDIPVDDCMRQATIREGLTPDDEQIIARAWDDLGATRQIRRALKQERLLGGSVILGIMRLQNGEKLSEPLTEANIEIGDLEAVNVIDVVKMARTMTDFDPFSPTYDRVGSLYINGIDVHASRMVVFDGDSLFGRNSQRLMQNFRYNPLGFGESKLAPLYDALMRSLGTQQAAYQLVNVASVILMTVQRLRNMNAVDGGAEDKLKDVMRQMSIYNAAIIDGEDVNVDFRTASFGSVPELVQTYTQFLAAAADIPLTRFMSTSPGGLDSAGNSDSRNYYDKIDAMRDSKRLPAERTMVDWVGASAFGYADWKQRSRNLKLTYPPLWNLDAVQEATRDEIVVRTIVSMYTAEMITGKSAVRELLARELFDTELEAESALFDTALSGPPTDTDNVVQGITGGDLAATGSATQLA